MDIAVKPIHVLQIIWFLGLYGKPMTADRRFFYSHYGKQMRMNPEKLRESTDWMIKNELVRMDISTYGNNCERCVMMLSEQGREIWQALDPHVSEPTEPAHTEHPKPEIGAPESTSVFPLRPPPKPCTDGKDPVDAIVSVLTKSNGGPVSLQALLQKTSLVPLEFVVALESLVDSGKVVDLTSLLHLAPSSKFVRQFKKDTWYALRTSQGLENWKKSCHIPLEKGAGYPRTGTKHNP